VTHYCLGDPDANKTSSKRSAAIASSGGPSNTTTATKHTVRSHFMSTKKRPHDDKRVIFFWRLLCLLIVFCRLPFSIVANLIFKAFIWFLDSSLPLPSRAKLTSQLLPELKEEASNRLKGLLKGVRGVALTFDLWMSRKTEDNLSVDVHFISSDWVWHHNHIGILSSADSTSSEAIADKMRPVLAEFPTTSPIGL